ncbi:MAG: hypothetical protein J5675_03725 [Bacteroidales bacterium]|nr:hypothetical protein [Bacteroidales bacterium]
MKKLFYIFSLVAAAALTLVSCVQEQYPEREESPAELATCYGVFFPPQDASGSHILSPVEDTKLTITVGRTNTEGAITVPVKTYFSEDGIFTLGDITFADGQAETTVDVRFDSAVEGTVYTASIVIEDNNYASLYNKQAISIDFDVMRVEVLEFKNPKTGATAEFTLNEGWWGEVHMAKMQYYEVNGIRTCTFISTEEGNGIWGDAVDATLKFTWYTQDNNNEGNNFLEVPKQYFGFDYNGWASVPEGDATYPIYVYDYPWYWVERGYAFGSDGMGANWLEEAKATGQVDGKYPVGYYDGNGGFYFNLRYYIPGLGGFSPDPYEFVAICDGFVRVDYSLDLEAGLTVDGATPVAVTTGVDVASVKYAAYEGVLTATQVANKAAEIEADENAAVFTDLVLDEDTAKKSGVLAVAPEATGEYTLVAIALDEKGKVQNSASVNFTYVDAENPVPVVIACGLEKTGKYAKDGYTTENSLEFYVYGEDIVDAKIGVFKYIDIASNGVGVIAAAVKASKSVSADAIEAINGDGYVDIATGLIPGTEFYLVVWASNGYEETVILSDGATTDGDPLPIYQDYDSSSYYEAGAFANREAFIGKWNYYGLDVYGTLGLREYLGQVEVTASETETEGPDDSGLYDEYVNVTGLFGDISWLAQYGFPTEATVEMDVYGGIVYQFSADNNEGTYKVYAGAKALNDWGYNATYCSAFIPVADGYYAFVDVSKYAATYNFCGLGLYEAANGAGWIAKIWDPLLVDPAKDDNGVAPASIAAAKKLFQEIAAGESFDMEPKQRIHNIIDKYNVAMANKFAPAGLQGLDFTHRQVKVNVTSRPDLKVNFKSNRELVAD